MQQIGRIHVAAFSDEVLWNEISGKAAFWQQPGFYGVDITGLQQPANAGYFEQVDGACMHAQTEVLQLAPEMMAVLQCTTAYISVAVVADCCSIALLAELTNLMCCYV